MAEIKLDPKTDPSGAALKAEKLSAQELLAQQKALAERAMRMGPHAIEEVLERTSVRTTDQRQEQQLYASTWGGAAGVIAALIKVTDSERDQSRRKALEAMQNEMFELMAKEKKKDALRNSSFFKQLVSILGPEVAESITQKLETAGTSSASGLQANQAAIAQASKDIAAILERNQAILGLGITGEKLSSVLEREITTAVARVPTATATVSLVRPEDALATKAHELMKGLDRGDERLARLKGLYTELGAAKFTAMLDAYDKKYGIPLVAHIAILSTSNASAQAEMMRETGMLLTLAQQERVIEYGRAEYAQTMALLDKQREMAKDSVRDVIVEVRKIERDLAQHIGRPELATLPEGTARAKILEELANRFPTLAGKTWEEAYIRLKDVAGQSDRAAREDALRALAGTHAPKSEELREFIARTTVQMQQLAVLDQRLDVFRNILSTHETGDEAKLRAHYTAVYGNEATTHDKSYEALKNVAAAHIDSIHRKISDPKLSSEQRAALIRERDTLEFACVRKLAAQALHGAASPDANAAIGILSSFAVAYADTSARRSEEFLGVCEHLVKAIESANTLRTEWEVLDVDKFRGYEALEMRPGHVASCIDARPARVEDMRLSERFTELNAPKNGAQHDRAQLAALLANTPSTPKVAPAVTPKTHFEVLAEQRQAALSVNFFAHILEDSARYSTVQAAPLTAESRGIVESKGTGGTKAKASLDNIVSTTAVMDELSRNLHRELVELEAAPKNVFLSADTQKALSAGLSHTIYSKLNAASADEAVHNLIRELDPVRDLPVDREVLDAIRKVVPAESALGKAFAAVRSNTTNATGEYEAIKAALEPTDGLRFELLVAKEMNAIAQGKPSVAATALSEILALDPNTLYTATVEAREHARLSRIERLLGALSEEETQEFLRFFEATTQRSIGASLIATLPTDTTRSTLLLRLAGSRSATSRDLQQFYAEPVPAERSARVAALARVLEGDARRSALKVDQVREAAQRDAYEYTTLRSAVRVAMREGNVALVGDITEKMRDIEARLRGTVAKTVAQCDATFLARTGIGEALFAMQEGVFQDEGSAEVPFRPNIPALAKETAELLSSGPPKTDAAFNKVRQANLTEHESLYLRALYAQEVKRGSSQLEQRVVTGDLARDLEPKEAPATEEKERIALLVRGGQEALREFDRKSLLMAEKQHNEKLQLDILSNLRNSGQVDRIKELAPSVKLSPKAQEYSTAVLSGDTKKADATDLSLKAKNGDVKPQDVAHFLKDKTSEDLERLAKEHPELAGEIAAANTSFTPEMIAQLLSAKAAERQKAIEQAMLRSLTSPNEFAAWLEVQGSREEKRARIRNLEALLEAQRPPPVFVEGAGSKIFQYVREQKTDFREIDAHLIQAIIETRLAETQTLRRATVDNLLRLRDEAETRMKTLDAFDAPRRTIYNAAQQNLIDKRTYLQEALDDQGKRWISAGKYDTAIALTKARITEQDALIRPMEHGIRDIESSRELVRYAFALMAKDAIAEVDRGLAPESTDSVTALLEQRDRKIVYKVTDERRDAEWQRCVQSTALAVESFDRWATIGLGTAKFATTVAAGVFFSPAAALIVASAWNLGDKVYRSVVRKESFSSLAKAFALELAIDTALCSLSALKTNVITMAGGSAVKKTAAEGLKVTKRVWEFKFFRSVVTPSSVEKAADTLGSGIFHAKEFGTKVNPFTGPLSNLPKLGEKYFQKLAVKVTDPLLRSNWVQGTVSRTFASYSFSAPSSLLSETKSKRAPTVPNTTKKADKSSEQSLGSLEKREKPTETEVPLIGDKKKAESTPAIPQPVPPVVPPVDKAQEPPALIEKELPVQAKTVGDKAAGEQKDASPLGNAQIADGQLKPNVPKEPNDTGTTAPATTPPPDNALGGVKSSPSSPGDSSGSGKPPPPPSPPPIEPPAPPPPPKDPDPPAGGGSGGVPGPGIVMAPTIGGDSQSRPRRDGVTEEQQAKPLTIPQISMAALPPRVDVQGTTLQDSARRSVAEDARSVPNPLIQSQSARSSSYIPVSQDHAQHVQRATATGSSFASERELAVLRGERSHKAANGRSSRERSDETLQLVALKTGSISEAPRLRSEELKGNRDEAPKIAALAGETKEASLQPPAMKDSHRSLRESDTMVAQKADATVDRVFTTTGATGHGPLTAADGIATTQPTEATVRTAGQQERTVVVTQASHTAPSILAATDREAIPHVAESTHRVSSANEGRRDTHPSPLVSSEAHHTQPQHTQPSARASEPTTVNGAQEDALNTEQGTTQTKQRKAETANDRRMRALLLQQLMDQHTTKARREKILKALVALGISEVEYRKLILKLGEMDTARLAEEASANKAVAEPIAMTVEAPALREGVEISPVPAAATQSEARTQTTRAALYKRLKEESSFRQK
ncbi:MAG: hypothetical protein RL518_1232 [Pseudomonadota bacterium]